MNLPKFAFGWAVFFLLWSIYFAGVALNHHNHISLLIQLAGIVTNGASAWIWYRYIWEGVSLHQQFYQLRRLLNV